MFHIVYVYWVLILLLVLPSLPFNRVAAVVLAQRGITQFTWEVGIPEIPAQMAVFAAAFVVSIKLAKCPAQRATGCLFFAMAIAAPLQIVAPVFGWWAVFWCACAQAVAVPFGNDWALVREGIESLSDLSWIDGLFRRERHSEERGRIA